MSERTLEDEVRYEVKGAVAWITIDRPERGNALSPECRDRLRDLFRSFNGQFEVRAAVLTAAGDKLFCPGADISTDRQAAPRPEGAPPRAVGEARRMMLDGQHTLMPSILDCEIPVIAAVNGTAAGMGAHLAMMCDLVIMAEESKFIEIFSRRALVPDALGTWVLTRNIGLLKAKELMFFADDIPADEALRLGLCNKVVPRVDLLSAADEWAQRLAAGPTRAYALTKWLTHRAVDHGRHTISEEESWAVELNTSTEDFAEGMASFRERRDPEYRGW